MKKEVLIGICGMAFLVMLIIALFNHRDVQDTAQDAFHEIRTFDMWKQSAYRPAAYCPTPGVGQGYYSNQGGMLQQIAMSGAPAILQGQEAPVLVKEMGAEVMAVGGGKVKITGVMGNSWADKAGLKAGDILLTFNTSPITSLKQFQTLLSKAPPEKDYKITYLRSSRKKQGVLTIGEGEMEGFTAIPKPK